MNPRLKTTCLLMTTFIFSFMVILKEGIVCNWYFFLAILCGQCIQTYLWKCELLSIRENEISEPLSRERGYENHVCHENTMSDWYIILSRNSLWTDIYENVTYWISKKMKFQNPYPEKKAVPIMFVMRTLCPDWYIVKFFIPHNIGLSKKHAVKHFSHAWAPCS